jgi:hypothetical protein
VIFIRGAAAERARGTAKTPQTSHLRAYSGRLGYLFVNAAAPADEGPRGARLILVVVVELADMMLGVKLGAELGDQIDLGFEEVDMMLLVAHQLLE